MMRIPYLTYWLEMRRLNRLLAARMITELGAEQAYYKARALKRECFRSSDPDTRQMGRMWKNVRRSIRKQAKIVNLDAATSYSEPSLSSPPAVKN